MASKNQVLILLISLLTLSSIIKPTHGGKIAVYWGQESESGEGNLTEACNSGLYDIVAIAYLHVSGSNLSLVLSNHCPSGDCRLLDPQIQDCQNKSIQVFLSIEIDNIDDPDSLAKDLYDNFLSGKPGPLGEVALDGIDLAHIDYRSEPWAELVEAISGYSTEDKKIYISGAPHCNDASLDSAISTGLFDYLWVLYYGDWAACEYLGDGNFTNLLESWAQWTSKPGLENTSVFLGLVASNDTAAASYGYISPELLKSQVLPIVKESSNYGGVMIWNRYYDEQTGYSGEIKDAAYGKFKSLLVESA